ncbi:hypothetical protein, partial [Streptomyces sp. NPDC001100]
MPAVGSADEAVSAVDAVHCLAVDPEPVLEVVPGDWVEVDDPHSLPGFLQKAPAFTPGLNAS